jgi:hypothetical protein
MNHFQQPVEPDRAEPRTQTDEGAEKKETREIVGKEPGAFLGRY